MKRRDIGVDRRDDSSIEDDEVARNPRKYHYRSGWVKIWRQIFFSDIWGECPHSWFRVFIALIGCANHDEKVERFKGQTIIVKPGSVTIGSIEFAQFCGVSRQQLRSALDYLVAEKAITIEVTSRFSIVTICNWSTYQSNSPTSQDPITTGVTTAVTTGTTTGITTLKEGKKNKKATLGDLAQTPLVRQLAERLHERHPVPRRDTVGEAATQIAGIMKLEAPGTRAATCELIDTNHALWCATYEWTKDGGQYAKGLVNWLAPTKRRWAEPPPIVGLFDQPRSAPLLQMPTPLPRYIPVLPPVEEADV